MQTHVVTITKKAFKDFKKGKNLRFYCDIPNFLNIDDLFILKIMSKDLKKYKLTLPITCNAVQTYFENEVFYSHDIAVLEYNGY